jgi:hypothetical protein
MRLPLLLILLPLAAGSSGCIVYPKKVDLYDSECELHSHMVELDATLIMDCDGVPGDEAAYCAAVVVGVGAATGLVSGSIMVVGNTYYYLDRQRRCGRAQHRTRSPSPFLPAQT